MAPAQPARPAVQLVAPCTEVDVAILGVIPNQVVIGMDKGRLYEQVQAHLGELEPAHVQIAEVRWLTSQFLFFFFQAEDGIRDHCVTGVQTCALPIFQASTRQFPARSLMRRTQIWSGARPASRTWHLPSSSPMPCTPSSRARCLHITARHRRSEERRVGKECRSRWWTCH